jgi:hypothetical protein
MDHLVLPREQQAAVTVNYDSRTPETTAMSAATMAMASESKAQSYATHLNTSLLPQLESVRQNIAQVEYDIKE